MTRSGETASGPLPEVGRAASRLAHCRLPPPPFLQLPPPSTAQLSYGEVAMAVASFRKTMELDSSLAGVAEELAEAQALLARERATAAAGDLSRRLTTEKPSAAPVLRKPQSAAT